MCTRYQKSSGVTEDITRDVRVMLQQLWGLHQPVSRVPCNHPCSLMRTDISNLTRNKYWVAPKTDGIRMFMLFSYVDDDDYVVFIDRAFNMHRVSVTVPAETHSGTLLDGEWVKNADGSVTYTVFDVISIHGFCKKNENHSTRMAEIVRLLHSFRNIPDGLHIHVKRWYELESTNTEKLLSDAKRKGVPCDGLIFAPEHGSALRPGPQRDVYKWKSAKEHTVDMFIKNKVLYVESAGTPVVSTELGVELGDTRDLPDNCVVECQLTKASGKWQARIIKIRPDKTHPNDVRVARLTMQNIEENIQLDEFL